MQSGTKAFTDGELRLLQSLEGTSLSKNVCESFFTDLYNDLMHKKWRNVEINLGKLLHSYLCPDAVKWLSETDLGALVFALHVQPVARESSLSIRLATLLVAHWADALKLAVSLVHETSRDFGILEVCTKV